MRAVLGFVFWFSLAAFLLLGSVVVFGQIAGTVLQQRDWVTGVDEIFSAPAFVMSTVCALAALLLQYIKPRLGDEADPTPGTR